MTSGLRRAIVIAAIVPAILGGTTCITISQKTAFRVAGVVFRGTVLEVEYLDHDKTNGDFVTTFRVDRKWKGPVTSIMKIHSPRPFLNGEYQVGREYVIYAVDAINQRWDKLLRISKGQTVYTIGDCPLRLPADVAEESRKLGRGRAVKEAE